MSLKLVYHGKRRKGTGNKIHVLFVPEGMDDAGGHAFRHVWKCEQTTILVPDGPRSEWQIQQSKAEISLSEYAEKNGIDKERKVVFHLFKIGRDAADCDHAINMLKKEMKQVRK